MEFNGKELLSLAKNGFITIKIGDEYKIKALSNLEQWLTQKEFSEYKNQLVDLINKKCWDYLIDCFYQIIPFGTGGRRGEVGVGPNRINPWTIQSSAQGHSQYLIKKYGLEEAQTRGVVLAYDTREFFGNKYINNSIDSPIKNLNSKKLSYEAAAVYAANNIKVYLFDDYRTTPELSFAIRYLKTLAGDMFSASHNPPDHNGKKIYDEFGGQLIPPMDQELVNEVTMNVSKIKVVDFDEALKLSKIIIIGKDVDNAYIEICSKLSLSDKRNINIIYTPLHGTGTTSVEKVLKNLGFTIKNDPLTSYPSGRFENVTFNIPNPEVIQSYDTTLKFAKDVNADILISSDPDADRLGIMVNDKNKWTFLTGNEISIILTEYVISKKGNSNSFIVKTEVTTSLVKYICKAKNVNIIDDLLVGFKYIGEEMNKLERQGKIDDFLLGCEESHGFISGNYARDKDAVVAAIWLSELAAELKEKNTNLVEYLNKIYANYGYVNNYLTEIRLPGAEGMTQIQKIQNFARSYNKKNIGRFEIESVEDWENRKPIVSETDKVSKNGLVFKFKALDSAQSLKVTLRPSGTEPKIKMYFEVVGTPFNIMDFEMAKFSIVKLKDELEKSFMKICYRSLDIDFPDRGFLLFWQMPLQDKLKYFEIENEIVKLKTVEDNVVKKQKLDQILLFLGSDPIMKVDNAFKEKYMTGILEYIGLK